jgi:hypothetical protein
MIRFRNFLPVVALLAGAALLAMPTAARADFELRYSLNGGSFQTIGTTSNNPGSVSGSIDGINVTGTTSDNLTTGKSLLDLSIAGITNQAITSLVLEASVTSVPTTPSPQTLSYNFTSSGTSPIGEAWIDQSNQLYGGATGGPGGTNIVADTGAHSAPSSGAVVFSATPPYSFTEQFTLGALGSGTALSADFLGTVSVPAPAGLVLAIAGMPVLGLGAWLRRRKSKVVPA